MLMKGEWHVTLKGKASSWGGRESAGLVELRPYSSYAILLDISWFCACVLAS